MVNLISDLFTLKNSKLYFEIELSVFHQKVSNKNKLSVKIDVQNYGNKLFNSIYLMILFTQF